MTMGAHWQALWADRALALGLLGLLEARDVAHVAQVNHSSRAAIRREMRRFRRASGRLGLALWCAHHVRLEFQSHYQELETHSIARSRVHDPRVPPRVVSLWAERGPVPDGVVALAPKLLPKRTERGVAMRFVAAPDQKPMLTSVVQHQRRIYTVVTLKIVRRQGAAGTDNKEIVLRRLWYLKEFGEWRAMVSAADKRRLDAHGALCRYDLVSLDGSVALELDVPRGADSMMDYFLVKRASVVLPIEELMQPFVKKLRPTRSLALPTGGGLVRRCRVVLSFGGLDGAIHATYQIDAELTVEQQQNQQQLQNQPSTAPDANDGHMGDEAEPAEPPHARTGIESFDIVTIKSSAVMTINVPRTPGYVWLSLWDDHQPSEGPPTTTKSTTSLYYATAMLHGGAMRNRAALDIDAQWVPGTLESFPTPQSRQRRALKGFFHISVDMDTNALRELSVVAQHLPHERLEPYAASIESYSRPQ